jgi:hypothetical protein
VLFKNCVEFKVGAVPPPVPFAPWHCAQFAAKIWRPIAV